MDILLQDVLNTSFVVNYCRFGKRERRRGGGGQIKAKLNEVTVKNKERWKE